MAKPFRIGEVLHLFSLSVWFGCLAMTAVAAGILFPTVRDLEPVTPMFAKYPKDHWLIIAGHVGAKLFAVSDTVQLICGSVALLTLGLSLAKLKRTQGSKPWSMLARSIVMSVAIGLVAYQILILAPRMQTALHAFWNSAESGNLAEAERYRAIFDTDHPTASTLMGATMIAVMISWFFAAFALAGIGTPKSSCGGGCKCRAGSSAAEFEEPALVSGGRP